MKKSVLILILLISIVQTANYYADINIAIDNSGFVTIEGNTNHPTLLAKDSSAFTSKKQDYWTFNLTKNNNFSEFIYSVKLPESSSINYLYSTGTIGIENQETNLIVKGYGEDKTLSIIIQYQTEKTEDTAIIISIILIILFILSLAVSIFFYLKKPKKEKKQKKKKLDLSSLTERQKKIIKLLAEKNKPITQAEIQKQLKLPKASASRNINSLELKGLIKKEKAGITNLIKLAE